MNINTQTPIIIVSGYLGNGKTTLLQYTLAHSTKKIAIIMNEFGEIGIDTQTLEAEHVYIKEILEGCVCCSLKGELKAALFEVIEKYHPDIIIIETTGIAEPDSLAKIDKSMREVQLEGIVTVVDADALMRFKNIGGIERTQIKEAHVLILNKTDLVKDIDGCVEKLRNINSHAQIIPTQYSSIDITSLEWKNTHQEKIQSVNTDYGKEELLRHRHAIEKFVFVPRQVTKENLEKICSLLPIQVQRIKGYLQVDGKQMLFHYARGKWSIEPTPHTTKLVVIGEHVLQHKEQIVSLFCR